MSERNPYVIGFGKIPYKYIDRGLIIEGIIDSFNSDIPEEQAYKLTGIRGTGKTVTLTAIEKKLRQEDDWIVVGVKANADIMVDLIANLYSAVPFLTSFVDSELNLSAFGIGVNLSQKSPVASIDYSLKKILEEVKRKNKKVLVTIDEARKTDAIVNFIQEFQILIREEMPIYLLVAGLYEDIDSLENADSLTFFLRATSYEMTSLNKNMIKEDYKETLQIEDAVAGEMAEITKGYAFAYQALGKYMWDSKEKKLTNMVLYQFDEALSEKVYRKIWSELTPKDKWFLQYIAQKDQISASELLEITKKKHNEWSEPRKRLRDKGIIDVETRGMIRIRLPRFKEFIENQM